MKEVVIREKVIDALTEALIKSAANKGYDVVSENDGKFADMEHAYLSGRYDGLMQLKWGIGDGEVMINEDELSLAHAEPVDID